MLQGNPFETELVMRDRTDTVRHDMALQQPSSKGLGRRTIQRWWRSLRSTLRVPSFSPPNLEPIEDRQ